MLQNIKLTASFAPFAPNWAMVIPSETEDVQPGLLDGLQCLTIEVAAIGCLDVLGRGQALGLQFVRAPQGAPVRQQSFHPLPPTKKNTTGACFGMCWFKKCEIEGGLYPLNLVIQVRYPYVYIQLMSRTVDLHKRFLFSTNCPTMMHQN